jgi:hypothetical protein
MEIVLWIAGVLFLAIGIAISIGLHELGHYFGWDEDDLAARDLD